VAESFHAEVQQ
jgi:hypothetical protein